MLGSIPACIQDRVGESCEHLAMRWTVDNYRHSIYLSASWSHEHDPINFYVARRLVDEYGLLVVGDHKAYVNAPHERNLSYRDRVDEILQSCSGMVALFPRKSWEQTTAPYMFLELLLAMRHGLPVLLLCEEGVEVHWKNRGNDVLLTFGPGNVPPTRVLSVDDVCSDGFKVATLKNVHAVALERPMSINEPVFLPSDPEQATIPDVIPTLMEEFASSFRPPSKRSSVFNIMPYAKEHERVIVANAVFEETGLVCINGSDVWAGAPFTREEIIGQIRGAQFVIVDLSGNSRACIFEAGIAIGSGRDTFAITRTPETKLSFGPDQLHLIPYTTDFELDRAVRSHCRPYRRRVFNIELSSAARQMVARTGNVAASRLIVLLHGIRTQATWQEMIRSVLSQLQHTEVVPIKYGFFDAFRFWFPFWTRKKPVETARWKIEAAIASRPDSQVTIIAHSFGTYTVARLMAEVRSFRPHRVLLCGAIVRQDYRWDLIDDCPEVLNDCGRRDIWPIFATAFSWGYGPSGTFGFGTAGVRDRYHDFGHSDYFERSFVERYWKPWIDDGTILNSDYETGKRATPYWMSFLTVPSIRTAALVVLLVIILGLVLLR